MYVYAFLRLDSEYICPSCRPSGTMNFNFYFAREKATIMICN